MTDRLPNSTLPDPDAFIFADDVPDQEETAAFSGRNSLSNFDLLHLLTVLATAQQTGALRVERDAPKPALPTQQFSIWLSKGRVVQAQGPYNLSGTAALAELLRGQGGQFYFQSGELAPAPTFNLSTDEFGYQALLLLPPPELTFGGALRVVSIDRLDELDLTELQLELLENLDLSMPLVDAADTPEAQHFVARLLRLGLLTRRRLRVAHMVVQLTFDTIDQGFIDDAIYQTWCKARSEKIAHAEMRLSSGQEYLLPVAPRKNLGASLLLPPDVLIRTGLSVGEAVLLRPQGFAK